MYIELGQINQFVTENQTDHLLNLRLIRRILIWEANIVYQNWHIPQLGAQLKNLAIKSSNIVHQATR